MLLKSVPCWLPWSPAADEVHLIKEEVHHRALILPHSNPSLPFTSEVGARAPLSERASQGLPTCSFSPGSSHPQNLTMMGNWGLQSSRTRTIGDISWIRASILLLFSQTTGEHVILLEGPASSTSPSYTEPVLRILKLMPGHGSTTINHNPEFNDSVPNTFLPPIFLATPILWDIDKDMKGTPGGNPGASDKLTMEVYVLEALRSELVTWVHTSPASKHQGVTCTQQLLSSCY